jgi:hypothetical protein
VHDRDARAARPAPRARHVADSQAFARAARRWHASCNTPDMFRRSVPFAVRCAALGAAHAQPVGRAAMPRDGDTTALIRRF